MSGPPRTINDDRSKIDREGEHSQTACCRTKGSSPMSVAPSSDMTPSISTIEPQYPAKSMSEQAVAAAGGGVPRGRFGPLNHDAPPLPPPRARRAAGPG